MKQICLPTSQQKQSCEREKEQQVEEGNFKQELYFFSYTTFDGTF